MLILHSWQKEWYWKCNKLVCNINDKENYVVYIGVLKQALNHGLNTKKTTWSNSV